jgi:O-antigen ligase
VSQRWGVLIGWLIVVLVVAGLASAKTWAVSFPILGAAVVASEFVRGRYRYSLSIFEPYAFPLIAFFLYLMVSLTWCPTPQNSFFKLLFAGFLAIASLVAQRAISSETDANIVRIAEGLWISTLFGLCYLAADLAFTGGSGGIRSLPGLTNYMTISHAEVTRAIMPVTMLTGPALLSIAGGIKRPWSLWFASCLTVVAIFVVAISPHETSKLALISWIFVLGLTHLSSKWAYYLLAAGWVSACLLVLPLSFAAHRLDLQHAPWLQTTARERVLIWHEYAQQVGEKPVWGHGFDSSSVLRPEIKGIMELSAKTPPAAAKPYYGPHPHNCYIQIWFELGAVGAIMFMVVGLSLLKQMQRLPASLKPLIFATYSAVMALLFSSYGLWQYWLLGLLAFVPVACVIAARINEDSQDALADLLPSE